MAREDPQFRIRLPAELKAQLEQSAGDNSRSLNAEIVQLLEQALPRQAVERDFGAGGWQRRVAELEELVSRQRQALDAYKKAESSNDKATVWQIHAANAFAVAVIYTIKSALALKQTPKTWRTEFEQLVDLGEQFNSIRPSSVLNLFKKGDPPPTFIDEVERTLGNVHSAKSAATMSTFED